MSKTNKFEFHKLCRTCLSGGILKPLYHSYSTQQCFGQMLIVCTEVQCHENDGLPGQICDKCINELNQCYNFALKCRQSDNTLRNYIERYAQPHCSEIGQENDSVADPLDISILHNELDLDTFMIKQETDIDASSEADGFRTDSYEPETSKQSNQAQPEQEFTTFSKVWIENASYTQGIAEVPEEKQSTSRTHQFDPLQRLSGDIKRHSIVRISETGKLKRKRCKVCYANKIRKDTSYMCKFCKIPLHFGKCFESYHLKIKYNI